MWCLRRVIKQGVDEDDTVKSRIPPQFVIGLGAYDVNHLSAHEVGKRDSYGRQTHNYQVGRSLFTE